MNEDLIQNEEVVETAADNLENPGEGPAMTNEVASDGEMTKEEQEQADEDQKNAAIVKEKCEKFFNEELKTLDMPLLVVDNVCKNVLGALFKIHQAKSKSFQEFLAARKKVEEEMMNYVAEATE